MEIFSILGSEKALNNVECLPCENIRTKADYFLLPYDNDASP